MVSSKICMQQHIEHIGNWIQMARSSGMSYLYLFSSGKIVKNKTKKLQSPQLFVFNTIQFCFSIIWKIIIPET